MFKRLYSAWERAWQSDRPDPFITFLLGAVTGVSGFAVPLSLSGGDVRGAVTCAGVALVFGAAGWQMVKNANRAAAGRPRRTS
jgi:hypothetical protein